jgi:peptidyl-prolyl cis-trans isomerase A (cyclophilin A)
MKNTTTLLSRAAIVLGGLVLSVAAQAQNVRLSTNQGDIVLQLDAAKAPKTVENFLAYVNSKHYDGTIFHRVMDGFMVQAGGYTFTLGEKSTRGPIPLEANNGLKNDRGTIAMARTNSPNSATAQFFINVVDNAMLNAKGDSDGYAVFGKVISGMETIDKIRVAPNSPRGMHGNVPNTPIVITSATLVK